MRCNVEKLKRVIESYEYHTQDIDECLKKPYLKVAVVSYIVYDTELPKNFVEKVVELIYAG